MADRRQLFSFLFWTRRAPAAQTPSSPPSTTTARPTAQSLPVSRQSTTIDPTSTTPPPTAQTQTPSPPPSTTLDLKTSPPSEMQTADQPTITTLTNSKDELKTSSPSITTKSRSSSKPASPSRRKPQSKSPPQPSFPSDNAKPPSTPERASQPISPSRFAFKQISSKSPQKRQPSSSPSKESRQIAQEEPQLKAEVESNGADNEIFNEVDDTRFKHNEVKEMTSKSAEIGNTTPTAQSTEKYIPTEKLETSTINGEHEPLVELKAKKPEETKDVKEIVQATKLEDNEERKYEVNGFLNPKSGSEGPIIEKPEIPRKSDVVHAEKQELLEREDILPTSQLKKRNTNPGTHNKSAQTSGEHVSLNKDIRGDISTFVNQMAVGGDPQNAINDRNASIITLAGENRGASMQMGPNSLKEGPVHIHRGYKINPDESAETNTDGEGSSKGEQSKNAKVTEDQPTEAYVNSNAQGINNSIVFNASIEESSPGVHMVVTCVPKEPIRSAEKISPLETRKAEFNITHAEKLTYEPTVRQRCLRGLSMETSDSDSEKPRRHGCRIGCKLKEKNENNIDIL